MESITPKNLITRANNSIMTIFKDLSSISNDSFQVKDKIEVSEDLMIDDKLLETSQLLGAGAAGRVFIGKRIDKNQEVAIKEMDINSEDHAINILSGEIAFMTIFKNENLINCIGYSISEKKIKLVMELCKGGSAYNAYKNSKLNAKQKLKIIIDTAKGLRYLHSLQPPLIHRDIKPLNILIDKQIIGDSLDFTAKIADYGVSRIFSDKTSLKTLTNSGTPIYMAPELLIKNKAGIRVDVYSFGIMVHELFSEKIPYFDWKKNRNVLTLNISAHKLRPKLDHLKPDTPEEIKELMKQCWDQDQNERPDFEEIVPKLEEIYNSL